MKISESMETYKHIVNLAPKNGIFQVLAQLDKSECSVFTS